MKLGYMTNGFGPLVGVGGGVTSVKDIRYLTICDDADTIAKIANVGFHCIEVLEGNLTKYADNIDELKQILKINGMEMMSVCVGANGIEPYYLDADWANLAEVARMAKEIGVTYIGICGGAIRARGVQEGDYKLLAEGLDLAKELIETYGLKASYHPHLGSMAETPDQIDKLFALTKIDICPDLAHIAAGGGDPLEVVKKYYDRISFMHLKDLNKNGFAPLGAGSVDIKGVIAYLKERGYEGDWLVEVDGYAGDPVEACQASYDYLKGLLV